MHLNRLTAVAALTLLLAGIANAGVIYVDDDALLGGDGQSWSTAFRRLQNAFLVAQDGDEIRIAGGIYRPNQCEGCPSAPIFRENSFVIPPIELRIVGGYRGLSPGGNPNQQNPDVFPTVLSGDLAGNDGANYSNRDDNSYNVVRVVDPSTQVRFEHLTLKAGASAGCCSHNGGAAHLQSATRVEFMNCSFESNHAYRGGAVYINSTEVEHVLVEGCTFEENGLGSSSIASRGGAIYVSTLDVERSNPLLVVNESNFINNAAGTGGGIYVEANATTPESPLVVVSDSHFIGNAASGFSSNNGGGGMWIGSNTLVERCRFAENSALVGGIDLVGYSLVRDCEFVGNTGETAALQIRSFRARVERCRFIRNRSSGYGAVFVGDPLRGMHSADIIDCDFLDNEGTYGAGLYLYSRGAEQTLVRNCRFVDNLSIQGALGGIYGGAGIRINVARPTILECLFVGNRAVGQQAAGAAIRMVAGQAPFRMTVANSIFAGNTTQHPDGMKPLLAHGTAVYASTSPNQSISLVTHCLVVGNAGLGLPARAVQPTATMRIDNSSILANQGGGAAYSIINNCVLGRNVRDGDHGQAAQVVAQVDAVNYSAIQNWDGSLGGVGNIGDDPLFTAPITGEWTSPAVYDPETVQTTFYDVSAAWIPGQLAGRFINPDDEQMTQSVIVSNTSNSVTAWGNFASLGATGASYAINDYRLTDGSPCIDAGDNTAVSADLFDLDGDGDMDEPSPFDLEGCWRFDDHPGMVDTGVGPAPVVDIGPYEFHACVGDVNNDREVGLQDLAIVLNNFGEVGALRWCDGDFDNDGIVGLSDLAAILGAFGEVCP